MSKTAETRDVQAQAFGFANRVASAYGVGESRACTISGLVVSGSSTFSHVTDDSVGQMILVSTSATFDTPSTIQYGIVQSHTTGTSTAFTVDAWYTLAGAAGASANSGDFYVLLPVAPPFWFIALTTSVSAVAGTETGAALGGTEHNSNGLARAKASTITRTVGSTTATMAHTFTYTTTGSVNIGRAAIVNSMTDSKKFLYFVDQINSGTPAVVASNGDTFTPTFTITVG